MNKWLSRRAGAAFQNPPLSELPLTQRLTMGDIVEDAERFEDLPEHLQNLILRSEKVT